MPRAEGGVFADELLIGWQRPGDVSIAGSGRLRLFRRTRKEKQQTGEPAHTPATIARGQNRVKQWTSRPARNPMPAMRSVDRPKVTIDLSRIQANAEALARQTGVPVIGVVK